MDNPLIIRKQGRCICDECGEAWKYDYEKVAHLTFLEIGHTDGFTRYLKCSEHKEKSK